MGNAYARPLVHMTRGCHFKRIQPPLQMNRALNSLRQVEKNEFHSNNSLHLLTHILIFLSTLNNNIFIHNLFSVLHANFFELLASTSTSVKNTWCLLKNFTFSVF